MCVPGGSVKVEGELANSSRLCHAVVSRVFPLPVSMLRLRTAVLLFGAIASVQCSTPKRGLSGLEGCSDATSLNLASSWSYNWNLWPTLRDVGGNKMQPGATACDQPQTAEYVPMFWSCWTNCTTSLWPTVRADWKGLGVKYLLGFNEPDNAGQSNLTPEQASIYWDQVDDFANTFDPPLELVGPGMTHWDETGGSPWLDQFLGNLSDARKSNIKYLAQHDYSGDADGVIARANAAYKKYGRQIWLTEFSVGSGAGRAANDAFMAKVLPQLDAADSVFRYAWYSTRNAPAAWVNSSCLLPPDDGPGWSKFSGHACSSDQMLWLSQHGTADMCKAQALDNAGCAEPKTVVYQSGDVQNCYCANTTTCDQAPVSWQDTFVHRGEEQLWGKSASSACQDSEMAWLSQQGSLRECQAAASDSALCASAPTKVVAYQTGDVKNCYCLNTTSCTKTASTWQDLYTQPKAAPLSQTPTSTGHTYASL